MKRPVCLVSANEALRFDRALYQALSRSGYRRLYSMFIVEADDFLRALDTPTLQIIGTNLAHAAWAEELNFAARTKFHCFAMCVADHLLARGALLP